MLNELKLVVFDMAGTTLKDEHEVEYCFARASQETGLNATKEDILAAQGWSKRRVFETFWERQIGQRNAVWQAQVENSFNVFKEILESYYSSQPIRPTDGCLEVFDFLKQHHISIALTTGFYRKVADIILERLGWLEGLNDERVGDQHSTIQLSITSDEVKAGRPAPDMIFKAMNMLDIKHAHQVVKVGDTPSDLQAGKAADCRLTLGVTNGTHSWTQLKPYPHDFLLSGLKEILPLFTQEMALV